MLLLSATPYKMYTLAEERELTGDDHYADFMGTVDFLERPGASVRRSGCNLRLASSAGEPSAETIRRRQRTTIEGLLRKVMCRTERPVSGLADMLVTKVDQPAPPTAGRLARVRCDEGHCRRGRRSAVRRILEVGAVLPQLHGRLPALREVPAARPGRRHAESASGQRAGHPARRSQR